MLLVLLLAAAGLLLAPQAAASGALQGLRACGTRVIPALLPFFVVSRMLTALSLPTPGRPGGPVCSVPCSASAPRACRPC